MDDENDESDDHSDDHKGNDNKGKDKYSILKFYKNF